MSRARTAIVPNPSGVPIPLLSASPAGISQINLFATWTTRPDVRNYQIDYAPTPNGPWSTLLVQSPNSANSSLIAAQNGIPAGSTLYYRAKLTYTTGRQSAYCPPVQCATSGSLVGTAQSVSTAFGILNSQGTTSGAIVYHPGIRVRIGGYGSMGSLASIKAVTDQLFGTPTTAALDVNHRILGICVSPTFAQLEGATLGDYSAGQAAIAALISLLKSYSPPRDLTIEVNALGNGYGAQTGTGYLSSFAPAYMNSSTYGGGEVHLGTPRPYMIIWNQNVANRFIALFRAYNNRFGPDTPTGGIYRWDPFQEISINEGSGGYSPGALLSVWSSYMSGLRAAAPNTLIMVKPTFINPNDGTSYGTLVPAMFNNHISMANEDCADNRSDWGTNAYLGLWASTPTNYTTNNGGNPGWDFHANVDAAELFQAANSSQYNNVVPPAQYGSGRIYDQPGFPGIWTRVKTLKASHIDLYVDAFGGPNVNRRVFVATAPANPTPGPGAGLVAAHPNIIDVLTGNTAYAGIIANGCVMPWIQYPKGYP